MPIRPENKARYPADWPAIRLRILQRARYRCEHPGCGAPHRTLGYWHENKFRPMSRSMRDAGCKAGSVIACFDGPEIKIIKLVLTIAHLDHTPEHCEDDNLRAWCQRHHLAYDAEHHKLTAYATRKAAANTHDLFER